MIRIATKEDVNNIALLASNMWGNKEMLATEFENIIKNNNSVVYLFEVNCNPVAFAQCSLRFDYVEGTSTSPVGYLEGVYVLKEYRKQGIAKQLVKLCEQWASKKGCVQFASDCEITNSQSYNFHIAVGFEEANKIICFKKEI